MKRFVLIDDDPLFGNILTRFANVRGAEVDYFESPLELEFRGAVGRYDAAIVDYDLGTTTGIDIAEHLEVLFGDIPMVLVSSELRDRAVPRAWPATIKKFVPKQAGFDAIFSATLACLPGSEGGPACPTTGRMVCTR